MTYLWQADTNPCLACTSTPSGDQQNWTRKPRFWSKPTHSAHIGITSKPNQERFPQYWAYLLSYLWQANISKNLPRKGHRTRKHVVILNKSFWILQYKIYYLKNINWVYNEIMKRTKLLYCHWKEISPFKVSGSTKRGMRESGGEKVNPPVGVPLRGTTHRAGCAVLGARKWMASTTKKQNLRVHYFILY